MPTDFHQLLSLAHQDWKTVLAYLGGGLAISVVTQILRHWHGLTAFVSDVRAHATGISRALVTGCSFVVAASNYILNHGNGPLAGLFTHTAILLSAAHVVYWVSVSPSYKYIMKLLEDAATGRQLTAPQSVSVAEAPPATFPD